MRQALASTGYELGRDIFMTNSVVCSAFVVVSGASVVQITLFLSFFRTGKRCPRSFGGSLGRAITDTRKWSSLTFT